MSIYIVRDEAILFLSKLKMLVVADLHIGYEYELAKEGIRIPSQVEYFMCALREAKDKTKADKVVLLGDVKHKVPKSRKNEVIKVRSFLEKLKQEFSEVIVCKGNHDDRIEDISPSGIKVYGSRGFIYSEYGFFHGHAWPLSQLWKAKVWVVGHIQPLLELSRGSKKSVERVIIKGKPKINRDKLQTIIVLPSFNQFIGGLILNKTKEVIRAFLLEKILDLENSVVYLLDGTEIGSLAKMFKPLK